MRRHPVANGGGRETMDLTPALHVFARALLVIAMLSLLSAANGDRAGAATTTVKVGQNASGTADRAFNPASLTIGAGDTVRWEWFADAHDVQGYNGSFSSGARGAIDTPGEFYARAFSAPGTYTYYCSNHAGNGDADPARIDERIANGKMVGKIVVVADGTGPATSAVTATPNPTSGAATFILSATITDSGTATSPIAGAEFFADVVGAVGTGTAMAAFDGSFDTPSEGVAAVVSTAGLSSGTHTFYVRGRDAAGNWGPTSTTGVAVTSAGGGGLTAVITLTAGTLSNTARPVTFPGATLNGQTQLLLASPQAWEASDATGSAIGWNVTVTGTDFSSSAGSIAVSNFKIRLLSSAIVTLSGAAPPATQAPSFVALDPSVATKLLGAAPGTGMGRYGYTPDFQLTIPASAAPGDYSASLVVSINSGP